MDASSKDAVTEHLSVEELTATLKKVQNNLSITQKINKRILSELKTWKEKALKLENNLKNEKRNNQRNITQLGFKMLQFENHLRKEQRDIESKFIDKENQIKTLEDVISSLHSRIKKNSLCYNCFVVKHNSPERCASPDSYSTKFPLDMNFSDHKPGNHGVLDGRSRSISLPLNIQSHPESPKVTNNEICFHHMLSPVPEELEVSISEFAKRSFKEPDIQECEDFEEQGEEEIKNDLGKVEEEIMKNFGNTEEEEEMEKDFEKAEKEEMKKDLGKAKEEIKKALEKAEEVEIKRDLENTEEEEIEKDLEKTEDEEVKKDLEKTEIEEIETMGRKEEEVKEELELDVNKLENFDDDSGNMITERENLKLGGELFTEGCSVINDAKIEKESFESRLFDNETGQNDVGFDQELDDKSDNENNEIEAKDDREIVDSMLPMNIENFNSDVYTDKRSECQLEIPRDIPSLSSEVHSIVADIITRVEQFFEHKHHLCIESVDSDTTDKDNPVDDASESMPQTIPEDTIQTEDGDSSNKMPLSPKSEAIVAELKRAIFDASIELEMRHEVVSQAASPTVEGSVDSDGLQNRTIDCQNIESTRPDISETIEENETSNCLNEVNINEIDLELNADLSATSEDGVLLGRNVENMQTELVKADTSTPGQCVDTLTEYDVIELD